MGDLERDVKDATRVSPQPGGVSTIVDRLGLREPGEVAAVDWNRTALDLWLVRGWAGITLCSASVLPAGGRVLSDIIPYSVHVNGLGDAEVAHAKASELERAVAVRS